MRRYGPIGEMNFQDAGSVISAITGGVLSAPGIFMVGTGARTEPLTVSIIPYHMLGDGQHNEVMWEKTYEPANVSMPCIIRDAMNAVVDLVEDVVYEPNGDDIIDYREHEDLNVVEQHIQTTGVRFGINLMSDDKNVQSIAAWVKQKGDGWIWGCDAPSLMGRGRSMIDAIQQTRNMVKSWWLSVGERITELNDQQNESI